MHDTQMLMTNENSRTLLVRPSKSQPGSVVMSMGLPTVIQSLVPLERAA